MSQQEGKCSKCGTGTVSIGTLCTPCHGAAQTAQASGNVPVPAWRSERRQGR